ncbi:selenocysteine-specific translation elongation factor [Rossellomorea aquimaris]|uniref:selenocysteine-specific translation elongation factor n=1 Tax=Rossellomorea aquimaris TaxID=189382 RepID=UPI0007D065FF|nr:selenocysteine-specific translation elongation factor [Rossellomorea aquimaris]
MNKQYFTIGMAGHIDHGKTTLTKALTNVDTDRFKEEKERNISIELGFAPLYHDEELEISVVDVPGHERFIRQMIAGVAGIDLVVLVVAADEGVMPQTREHLDILSLLGVENGIVVLSKITKVEEELRELALEEVEEELRGTVFDHAPVLSVDSISGEGITKLKEQIILLLKQQSSRNATGDFRLPIDQVFTVKGQGTVVRGTVYEGKIQTGSELTVLPQGLQTRARQIQVHHKKAECANAGQRTAINLSGVDYQELKRGNVLVSSHYFTVTDTIDVSFSPLDNLNTPIKQRMQVKVHIGTSEVMGKIVFFDRNEVTLVQQSILCQIRLEESIVVKRGDRFIVRRPTPTETIGGGWIINPKGKKYRFGEATISKLRSMEKGKTEERLMRALEQYKSLSESSIIKEISTTNEELKELLNNDGWVVLPSSAITHDKIIEETLRAIHQLLTEYHKKHPLLKGINRGEIHQSLQQYPKDILYFVIDLNIQEEGLWKQESGYVKVRAFTPHLPTQWEKRCSQLLLLLEEDGRNVKDMDEYFEQVGIPKKLQTDFYLFFVQERKIVPLDEKKAYAFHVYHLAIQQLKGKTGKEFEVGEAKEILGLSRKYIIPFLEKLDKEGLTVRNNQIRKWIEKK